MTTPQTNTSNFMNKNISAIGYKWLDAEQRINCKIKKEKNISQDFRIIQ